VNEAKDEMSKTTGLAAIISDLCPRDGSQPTAIKGLYLTRFSTTDVPRTSLDQAVFCVVAQGAKCTLLNDEQFVYDPNKYLLVSLDLPLVGQIVEASPAKPFLGMSLVLDFDEIALLMRESNLPHETAPPLRSGLMVGCMDDDLLDAVTRLAALLQKPAHVEVLAPLIRRKIFYLLLLSEQGALLRRMVADNGKVQRVASGLAWLRRNATRSIRMEELAREMRMSPSAMHSWFRAVTSMSPLQFQKQLRLQEARRILLSESIDAGSVSRRVGYESASQFSREYRRFFGEPPLRDVERLRSLSLPHP
jgi:AraC-like DNA-binding protein